VFGTRFTREFGIEHPNRLWRDDSGRHGRADLGRRQRRRARLLTALTQGTPENLAKEIARCRNLTDRPSGVNLTILPTITPVPYRSARAPAPGATSRHRGNLNSGARATKVGC
jgi:NADH:quinone reductase (non-electrogenic)